jgi:hypothetical protein
MENGRRISATVTQPEAQLEYRVGATTRALPNSLGIFVFTNLQRARDWNFVGASTKRIFECETEGPLEHPVKIAGFRKVLESIQVFAGKKASFARRLKWTGKFIDRFTYSPMHGSAVVPSVKPVKLVY